MSKQHRFTSRTKARKRAADVVFEADQRGMGRNPEVLRDLLRERRVITAALTPLPEYSIRIIEGVADRLRDIDDLLAAHARVAGLDRIAAVDLAVMRVAVWEMLENREDVNPVIAIDEAISIVKSLSTDTSPNFVNAVLDACRKDIESPAWSRRNDSADRWQDERSDTFNEDLSEFTAAVPQEGSSSVTDDPDAPATEATDEALSGVSYPSMDDITAADLEELDELLDEY
ncbi:transcription antitermination factor NusB [Schaalia vaccimaxillae]|uniref:transcription antitermination factor NusB n=1 Tax=Schaalia vaccimaxillae TaxID=183916 RepID=UPI0003B50EA5|nr:transcription antitermination factor NusB [Schaalia vaccimaxillae]